MRRKLIFAEALSVIIIDEFEHFASGSFVKT
jgi:hypothetical protein